MNTTNNFYIFEDICQDSPFWNDEVVSGPEPKFTECFQTTVLEWLPFLWLVLSLPVYPLLIKYYLLPAASIPFSTKSFVKTALCLFLFILSLLELWSNGQYGYFCDGTRQPVPAFYLGLALRCVSIVIVAVLIQVVRIKGVVSSAVIFIYWLAMLLCAIIPLQTAITYHPSCASSILKYLYFITLVLQTILHCFADKRGDYMQQALNSNKMGTCPDVDSSFPSRMIFFWMLRMVYYNFKKPIKSDEMWAQTPSLKYSTVVGQLSERWKKEVDEANRFNRRNRVRNSSTLPYANGYLERGGEKTPLVTSSSFRYDETLLSDEIEPRRPSLYRALFHTFIWDFLFGGLYNIVAQSFILLQPLLLREIVNYVDTKDFTETQRWVIVLIALGFYISGQMESISFHQSIHTNMSLGLKIKTSLIGMIYEKSLKLSSGAKRSYTVGEIVNLMSVDCQRIQDAFGFGYAFFALFIVGLVGFIELYYAMGLGVVGGAILVTILAVANVVLAKFQEKLQRRLLYFKGNRIKLFNEVIEGIKVIKMFAWEKTFSEKVLTIRNMESHYLRKIGIVTAWTLLFSVNSPFFMNYAVLLVHVASDFTRRLTPGNVFLVLNVVNIFRFPVTILPFLMTGMIQTYVSVGRIQHFLWGEELNTSSVEFVTDADHAIRVNGANFSWDKDQPLPTLRDINLKIKEGSLVAVVGTVGSGKSTLINSLLGETEKIRGRIQIKGSLAYVPQEAWIQNLTLRENILYGSEFKERKYWKVVEACALQPDLKILAAGDQTEIGQKGLNLSGGQKQRVSLARAVYSNSDIYLLDDPLSAVDPHVGKELFTKVIGKEGLLKNKTRILVTHGVHWLPYVDSIVVMDNGQISEMGSYDQLMRHNGPFAKFLESYLLHEPPPGDDTDPEIETVKDQIWEQIEHVFTQSEGGLTSDDGGYTKRHGRAGRRRSSLFMRSGLFSRATSLVESLHRKEEKAQQQAGQLIQEEEQEKGGISWSVVFKIAEGMGLFATFVAMMAVIGFQAVTVAGTYWLSDWSEDRYLANETNRNDPEYAAKNKYYLVGYTLFGIAQGICIISFGFIAFLSIVKANKSFHSTMLNCVLRSPMSFFDTTPNGRIMNRFSSDMDVMDDRFPRIFRLWAVMITTLIADVIVIAMKTPQVMYIFVPAAIIYFFIVIFYLPAARQLKRAESVLRTPVYNHFSETITGATVIRAFKSTDRFIDEIRNRVDRNCAFYYTVISAGRWISIIAEGISNIIVLTTALFAVSSDALTGGDAGLSLSYAVQIVIALNLAVLAISEMQMNIVSSERIVEYTKLDSEAEWVIPSNRPPSNWPNNGVIKFKEYTTRYRPGLELVLRGISCKVKSGEKVGIVGRTGAGKSSMTLSLFRLIERAGGRIKIDDVDISTIGLHDLRSKITILPQDPVLFTGSLRSNLDPLDKFDDDQIWRAIECAHLKNFVNSQQENMYYDVGEAGGNLSVGQRQLVCLGRALLHKSKILILDEATAAVDMETDELIQQTLKTEFWDCTVLTIAHRLNTILDYDRVMVLDKGLIVEFDTPKSLMDQPDGIFYGMAREADLLSWFDNRKKQN